MWTNIFTAVTSNPTPSSCLSCSQRYLDLPPVKHYYTLTSSAYNCAARALYRVRQKYMTIWQNSSEWNRWRGEFVLERSSSGTQSISVAMERWSVEHRAFDVGTYLKKQRYCLDSKDISSAIQYSSERVSLVAILLPLRISQGQGVWKDTKDNGGFETEHQGRSGSNFSQHAATSDAELPEALGGMCWQGTPLHRHYIQEVNVVINP